MLKKSKIIILVISIVIAIFIIHRLSAFILIPNMQRETVIDSFNQNFNKFENVHNYLVEKFPFSHCYKGEGKKVELYYSEFTKSGETKEVKADIDDTTVLQQIEYIFNGLDFEYFENIKDSTHFVFRDANGHFQSIDYSTQDLIKFKEWDTTRLKNNWYYRSIWTYFIKDYEESDLYYRLRVVYHVLRGY